jgi:hypothetical protein
MKLFALRTSGIRFAQVPLATFGRKGHAIDCSGSWAVAIA